MTLAKAIQFWALVAVGVFTMFSAVELLMAFTPISALKSSAFLLTGALFLHMITRPEPPPPASCDVILDALLAEHPVLGADPGFAHQLAATAHRAVRNPKGRR